MALTNKNKMFAREYVANGYNGTQAYLKVYECDYNSASVKSSVVLAKPEVKEFIKEIQKERIERLNISAERVLEELSNMAFAAKEDEIYNPNVKLKAIDLIQKQLNLQTQKIEATANVNQQVVIIDDIDKVE